MSGMPDIKAIAFYAYPVSDIAESRAFYENILGLKVTLNFQDKWIEYDIGPGTLAITTMAEERNPGAPGGFVAFEVDDLDAWIAELRRKHVTVTVEPFETPVCRMVCIADPDGNEITLHWHKPV
jgi:predicted enzyme related to lactoylglutathione lyase